jgi:hypothetical protein
MQCSASLLKVANCKGIDKEKIEEVMKSSGEVQ